MSNNKGEAKPGWGNAHTNKTMEKSRWNRSKPIEDEGFRSEVNPDWKFLEGTFFKNHQWGKRLYENEYKKDNEQKKMKAVWKRYKISDNPWKRKIDLIEISSDDESNDDSWNGIYSTDLDKQASKRRRKLPSKIIKDMNKMTAQKERVLDEMSKVENLCLDQDLFLKWEETVETVERRTKTVTKTVKETDGCKTVKKTVEVRWDKIETKIYKKL